MNAEVSAKELEKCKLLTGLFGQKVQTLDDYGCPKIKIMLEKEKWAVRVYALITLYCAKQGFTVPRGKQRCIERVLCNIFLCNFLYVFLVFVFTTNLILSTRHDFFYSIQFRNFERSKLDA